MTSLTIAVDEETLKRARVRAIQEGTSSERRSASAARRVRRLDRGPRPSPVASSLDSSARLDDAARRTQVFEREEIYDRRRAG